LIAGKVFVVTGAAGGIGRNLVERLLEQKAVVWALDRTDAQLADLKRHAGRQGWELRTLAVDVSNEVALRAAGDVILARDKRCHVWVNNAGISGMGDFATQSPGDFERVLAVNIGGVIHGTRLALEWMSARGGGAIVNMGSVAGFVPAPYLAAYSASKHAVVGFTRALREELRLKQSNVRLILVSPGFVDTQLIQKGSQTLGFPEWLQWALSPPSVVTDAILAALRGKQDEVVPTWNGRLMQRLHGVFPQTTRRGANLLLARSFKDWLLNRYTVA
jgi:short-subunit dehydrogenase